METYFAAQIPTGYRAREKLRNYFEIKNGSIGTYFGNLNQSKTYWRSQIDTIFEKLLVKLNIHYAEL